MPDTTKFRVLIFLQNNPELLIPAKLLAPLCGFAKLRREGYIRIVKSEEGYTARLTEKGKGFIYSSISIKKDQV